MKIKPGFVLREVGGNHIAIATDEASELSGGIIRMNTTGAFIWKCIETGDSFDDTARKLTEKFEVDFKTASSEVIRFADELIKSGIAEK